MNKRMIVLIALVVVVSAVPASAETLEVRGTIAELDAANPTIAASAGAPLYVPDAYNGQPGFQWDYSSFAGFWYDPDDDLQTETLTILSKERDAPAQDTLKYPGDREIGEGSLVYQTHPVFREYEMHQDIPDPQRTTQNDMEEEWDGDGIGDRAVDGTDLPTGTMGLALLDRDIGLCVESDNSGGDCGYYVEGWMGEMYVAIDDNADELCELLVEFEDDDKKTLSIGEEWDIGGGYSLTATKIEPNVCQPNKVWLSLKKDGREIDNEAASDGPIDRPQERVYTYTADLAQEEDVPVFSCYVDAISDENDTVQLVYVFLIDEDVLEIVTSDTYDAMKVLTASSKEIVLNNDETTIVLDPGTTKQIMGNMGFRIANDKSAIIFYPFVEHTGGGGGGGYPPGWGGTPAVQIRAGNGSDLPESIIVGETFTVLITENGSSIGAGTYVVFRIPYDTGDPVTISTDDDGKVTYTPLITGTLGIRVLNATGDKVAGAEIEVMTETDYIEQLGRVEISPDSVDISMGGTQMFIVTCYATDATGGGVLTGCITTWSCDSLAIGTINSSTGIFTATGIGTATITASATCKYVTLADTAIINVTMPPVVINDTDGDGVPDVWDADNSTPAGYWVNSDGIGRRWGDMNGDGRLTSVDALMILQAAVGKIDL